MADMTVKEIAAKKSKLDDAIWALVKEFEVSTKVKIDWISFKYPERECGCCCCNSHSHDAENHTGIECHIDTGIFD